MLKLNRTIHVISSNLSILSLFNFFNKTLNKTILSKKVAIIGGGFSGLSAASYLAKSGREVSLFEKNSGLGGRARQWKSEGFTFDMGPSWYWMPDVFDRFFADFGKKTSDYYDLEVLDPGFRVFFADDALDIPFDQNKLEDLFEKIEKGSSEQLRKFLKSAKYKYEVGMQDLVYTPGLSIMEFVNRRVLSGIFNLDLTSAFDKYVAQHFKDIRLRQLMEFPVLFLGAAPSKTPALYSLMNYAGLSLGTWYPKGGMYKIVEGMSELAQSLGVKIQTESICSKMNIENGRVNGLVINDQEFLFDSIVSSADYHFTEKNLLPESYRNYSSSYWQSRTMAPSSLIFYLGIEGKVDKLLHHNLFFDEDLQQHTSEIYDHPQWPSNPLFYVCCPSKTDESVAPENCENIFILMPLASGLEDTDVMREKYFNLILDRLENRTGSNVRDKIKVKKSYCINNFVEDYGAFKGNAYGLANTLRQTAIFKPKIKNKKLANLYYTGHLTVPGPGVPPSIISGKLVADQISNSKNT